MSGSNRIRSSHLLERARRLAPAPPPGNAVGDLADADIVQITPEVLASVVSLLESHPLRAMDALHVACALACEANAFVSADHRQLAAARKAGLKAFDVS